MTTAEIERVILWTAIEDVPALWSLVDEIQALIPDHAQATEHAQAAVQRLACERALTVLTARTVEGDTTPIENLDEAVELLARPQWWRTPDTYDEPVVRVDITPAGERRYQSLAVTPDETGTSN